MIILGVYHRRVLSPRGERTHAVNGVSLSFSVHVTLLVTLTNNDVPVVLELRTGTNTGLDFARFVIWVVQRGYLVEGDFLVVDGAKVHFSDNVAARLTHFLHQHHAISCCLMSRVSFISLRKLDFRGDLASI